MCLPCTACCDGWLQTSVNGTHIYPGYSCRHSTGEGCDDYENRPHDPCDRFICGWLIQQSPLPDWMKPNESRVIVIFNKLMWNGFPVDLAVPVGKRIPQRALNWLMGYAEKNRRPLLYTEQIEENGSYSNMQTVYGYGPPEFQAQVQERKKSGMKLW